MSGFVSFLASLNLFNGQKTISYNENLVASLTMNFLIVLILFYLMTYKIVKFFRFRNEKADCMYKVVHDLYHNEKLIKNFVGVIFFDYFVIEILSCVFITESFKTGREFCLKENVGFFIAPYILRTGFIQMIKPNSYQISESINRCMFRIRENEEMKNKRSIILLVSNENDKNTKNDIKKLPVELIRMLKDFIE